MGSRDFDSKRAFDFGFDTVFANLRFFLPLMVAAVLISSALSMAVFLVIDSAIASGISTIILNSIILLALFRISLGFLDNHTLSLKDPFGTHGRVLNFIAASLIY